MPEKKWVEKKKEEENNLNNRVYNITPQHSIHSQHMPFVFIYLCSLSATPYIGHDHRCIEQGLIQADFDSAVRFWARENRRPKTSKSIHIRETCDH